MKSTNLEQQTSLSLEDPTHRVRLQVLVPMPFEQPFDYWHEHGHLHPGTWVKVPLGPKLINGVVWTDSAENSLQVSDQPVAAERLKSILEVFDIPPLRQDIRKFVEWVAHYTLFPMGSVLRMVMRQGDFLTPPRPITQYRPVAAPSSLKMTPQREKFTVIEKRWYSLSDLRAEAGVSDSVIRNFAKLGGLETRQIDSDAKFAPPNLSVEASTQRIILSEAQSHAVTKLNTLVQRGQGTALLDGVTGSGKTEVYLEAVATALRRDPQSQVLILLPEIGLTLPFLQRITDRFHCEPAAWHSELTMAARRRVWRRVLDGNAQIVVGARSALFLPFANLRLIVVDEEHDGAYKQEEGVLYQGRDLAVARGAQNRFPVILASATPSLETLINAESGRYQKVVLPNRFGRAVLPDIQLIDLCTTPPEPVIPQINSNGKQPASSVAEKGWLAQPLINAITDRLERREQSLLFLNRRGYAPLTICRACGHRMTAPNSDTCLVEHRFTGRLVCHYTGYSIPKPKHCPKCNTPDGLTACGPGVERIADEVHQRWPDARSAILSSDIAGGPQTVKTLLRDMESGKLDILIATQAAAKGHHFPNLTLVGVVDADLGLAGGDLRAAERTFQLLSQVAGRAGRSEKKGLALMQTHRPNTPVLQALVAGDRDQFLSLEAKARLDMHFPPFGRLAAILLTSPQEATLKAHGEHLKRAVTNIDGVEVWGPAPAPFYRLNGQYRYRFLVRSRRNFHLQHYIRDWLARVKLPGSIKQVIDIDPYSFM